MGINILTFNSTKGGTGKTTLSFIIARKLLEEKSSGKKDNKMSDDKIIILDLDLTGTCYAEAFANIKYNGETGIIRPIKSWQKFRVDKNLNKPLFSNEIMLGPPHFLEWMYSKLYEEEISIVKDKSGDRDIKNIYQYMWNWGAEKKLYIISSSPFYPDIKKALSYIYTEEASHLFEYRLMDFVLFLEKINKKGDVWLFIDHSPTLSGLSYSTMKACMKLNKNKLAKTKLLFVLEDMNQDYLALIEFFNYLNKNDKLQNFVLHNCGFIFNKIFGKFIIEEKIKSIPRVEKIRLTKHGVDKEEEIQIDSVANIRKYIKSKIKKFLPKDDVDIKLVSELDEKISLFLKLWINLEKRTSNFAGVKKDISPERKEYLQFNPYLLGNLSYNISSEDLKKVDTFVKILIKKFKYQNKHRDNKK